ncbi:hypothetical protein HNY73_003519 [Argiope bruennichi]|uniref:Uncharacterized protein n=1 Tax=Argiope bruennichi TaxID=94029 RepID=A0A8T0FNU9_ARGBR|nr:hypothetical protein HNY73_003519 [Argiope bruennichi]
MQVFENSLQVRNSLSTDSINGKSLSEMVKSFNSIAGNYNRTLTYFDDLSYSLDQHISSQLQASVDRITRLAYFILVQEFNLGPTTKILYGHDLRRATGEFSHSMVIWTSEKQCTYLEFCCHVEYSYWMRVKKSGHLMIDGTPETGRYYPLQNPSPITVDKDFVFWTDSAAVQSKWCNNSISGELLLASLKASGEKEVFLRIKSAPSLSEVKSFWRGQNLYAVAGYYFDSKEDEYSSAVVYVFNEVRREWRDRQYLPSYGVLSLDITHDKLEDEILLAIGTGMGTYSSIYIWDDEENKFELLQNIHPKYVTSTLWLKQGPDQLLAMSSVDHWSKKEDCFDFLSGGQVDIFLYKGKAEWIQSIPLRGVVSMISLTLADDTFLIAASHQLQSIFIYEWKGYAGFSLIQSMFVGEVRHLNTYTIGDDTYITVAVTNGPSKLLKVVVQGKHAVSVPVRKEIVPRELKDEAITGDKLVPGC